MTTSLMHDAGFDDSSLLVGLDPAGGFQVIKGDANDNDLSGVGADGPVDIIGKGGDDTLAGGDFSDRLRGGGGDDLLFAGSNGGQDTLIGGAGRDTFAFQTGATAGLNSNDTIADLQKSDVIDLSRIDADTTTDGDQAFVRVDHFDHHPGEMTVVYDPSHGFTKVNLDMDGDGRSEITINVTGDQTAFHHYVL